uniref:MULE transposase domain-containing protein n=1 Tax=Lactuca sativa TaxID=4236 RepID=A0A9R1VNJ3_LACSA|nr:hypothetical protein LSAT_V11C400169650 [Lactuca sativa]
MNNSSSSSSSEERSMLRLAELYEQLVESVLEVRRLPWTRRVRALTRQVLPLMSPASDSQSPPMTSATQHTRKGGKSGTHDSTRRVRRMTRRFACMQKLYTRLCLNPVHTIHRSGFLGLILHISNEINNYVRPMFNNLGLLLPPNFDCRILFDLIKKYPEEETVAVNTVEEKNLYEFGRLTDKTLLDGEESNEGWSEDEFTDEKKASDIFYGMPPIHDFPDPIVEPGPFHSLGPNDDMFVRQTYDNKQQLIFALSLKIQPNHKHANKKVMGSILHEIMGKIRSKVWRPNEISRDLNALLEINVDYKQAWRAKQYAMELLLGSSEECFSKLPFYFHNFKRHNPGTVAYIQTDFEDCFECCFYAIGSTIRAFKRFCRKVIIMDGAHLKGDFKGNILHAVDMDENNQILLLAHRICKKESGLTWTWFLEMLYECVVDCQELTFVTDRADAIRVSIENVFPHAHHGLCAFHLLGNIVHRFGKIDKTKVFFWRLVKAYKRNVFEELWYRFSSTRLQVVAYLSEIPRAKWTRAYSMLKRYDYMTANSAESMNALSVDARKMPIIPLLEFFCRLSQKWCNKHRIEGGKYSTVLTEWAEKVVSKNEDRTTGWSVSGVSDAIYQVHDFKHGGIVDLRQETCTCKHWEGTGLPLWSCHNGLEALEKN